MNHPPRLAQRRGVHVFDPPRQRGRRAVVLAVDDVADAADGHADHGRGATRVDDLPVRESRPAGPYVGPDHRAEQAAPLADATLREGKDPEQRSARKELEVLPHIKEACADEAEDDHVRDTVRAAGHVDPVFLEKPQAKPRCGQDSQNREHSVPRDEEWSDFEEVRVQVDDDGEKHQSLAPIARWRRDIATSFGISASVKSMGGEIFLPVTARRIGMKILLGLAPDFSTTPISDSWMGAGSHGTSFSAPIAARTLSTDSGSREGGGGSVHRYSSKSAASANLVILVLSAGTARRIVASSSFGRNG